MKQCGKYMALYCLGVFVSIDVKICILRPIVRYIVRIHLLIWYENIL